MKFVEQEDVTQVCKGFARESDITNAIKIALLEAYDYPDLADDEQIIYAKSFKEAGWPATHREGLVIKTADGSEFQITVSKVN